MSEETPIMEFPRLKLEQENSVIKKTARQLPFFQEGELPGAGHLPSGLALMGALGS